MTAAAIVHSALCVALWWVSFCRCSKTCDATLPAIRFAFVMQASVSAIAAPAPLLWGYQPEWPALLLLAGHVAMQLITSLLWRSGVPQQYLQPAAPPARLDFEHTAGGSSC